MLEHENRDIANIIIEIDLNKVFLIMIS
jgi:hypothetical protein